MRKFSSLTPSRSTTCDRSTRNPMRSKNGRAVMLTFAVSRAIALRLAHAVTARSSSVATPCRPKARIDVEQIDFSVLVDACEAREPIFALAHEDAAGCEPLCPRVAVGPLGRPHRHLRGRNSRGMRFARTERSNNATMAGRSFGLVVAHHVALQRLSAASGCSRRGLLSVALDHQPVCLARRLVAVRAIGR